MAEISLLEALGSPSLELLPPAVGSTEWTARRNRLRYHLRAAGCQALLRTPASLWAAAGAQGRPCRLWAQLAEVSLATLTTRLLRPLGAGTLHIATWNARWLLSPIRGRARASGHSSKGSSCRASLSPSRKHTGLQRRPRCGEASSPAPRFSPPKRLGLKKTTPSYGLVEGLPSSHRARTS